MAGRSARFGAAAVFVALGALGVVCAVTQPTATTRSSQSAGAGDASSSSPGGAADNGGGSSDTTGTVAPGSSASPGAKPSASSSAKSTGGKKTTGGSSSTSGGTSGSADTGQGGGGQPLDANGSPNPDFSVGPPNYTLDPSTATSPNPGGGSTPTPAPSSSPACPQPPSVPNPIPLVQMTTTLAADGSAANPQTTFQASSTQKIIAVATLNNLPCGTRINYVWIHGTTYDPSQTFTLKTSLKHFYIQFAAPVGGTLTTGQCRIRYYVNSQVAYDISYQVV